MNFKPCNDKYLENKQLKVKNWIFKQTNMLNITFLFEI